LRCDGCRLFRSALKDRGKRLVIIGRDAFLERPQVFDDRFCELAFELAVAFARKLFHTLGLRLLGDELVYRQKVVDRRPRLVESDLGAAVGDRAFDLFGDRVCIIKQEDRSGLILVRFRHLLGRVLKRFYARTGLGNVRLWDLKGLTEITIEPLSQVPRQFQMLLLILADGNEICLIEQNVCRHQYGINAKPHTGTFPTTLLRLIFELRHSLKFAHSRYAGKYPREFSVLVDVGLDEDRRFFGVNTCRKVYASEIERRLTQGCRILRERDRMKVDNAVVRLVIILQSDPILQSSEVIPQMKPPGRLCSA